MKHELNIIIMYLGTALDLYYWYNMIDDQFKWNWLKIYVSLLSSIFVMHYTSL